MAIVQGKGVEPSEVPTAAWNGSTHPGRIRLQTFRPNHPEPLTDALIGQGMMSLGGGGYGGGGLPAPGQILELWGGSVRENPLGRPAAPVVAQSDHSGPRNYSVIAVGPSGRRSPPSPAVRADSREGGRP